MKKSIAHLSVFVLSSATLLLSCGNTPAASSNPSSTPASTPVATSEAAASSAVVTPSEAVSSAAEEVTVTLDESYITSEHTDGSYGDGSWNGLVHQLDLYSNGVYRYTSTELKYGYSMILGTTAVVTFGDYVKGGTEDGLTEVTLNAASEVFLNSYSKAGGFSIVVTTPNQEYPVELPAKVQGEVNMANSKEDVLAAYGQGTKVWVDASTYSLSFVDPNTDELPDAIETKSGAIDMIDDIKEFQIVNEFSSKKNEETGALSTWDGTVHIVSLFEDGSYDYMTTQLKYGYSMLLGTTSVDQVGIATIGQSEDDYTKVTLGTAKDVLLNSFSKAGGFNIQVNTLDQEYPVELPAKAQGEKNMANSKEDVINAYGQGGVVFLSDSTGTLSLVDPNAE